ncbi:hypothetical protein ACJW31_01G220600 [Castanea mollissima]
MCSNFLQTRFNKNSHILLKSVSSLKLNHTQIHIIIIVSSPFSSYGSTQIRTKNPKQKNRSKKESILEVPFLMFLTFFEVRVILILCICSSPPSGPSCFVGFTA